jgi:CheY-like chemotaxis protein
MHIAELFFHRLRASGTLVFVIMLAAALAMAGGLSERLLYPVAFFLAMVATLSTLAGLQGKERPVSSRTRDRTSRVLLVEDADLLQQNLKSLFMSYGVAVETLPTSADFLLSEVQGRIDLVILDGRLPYVTLRQIRSTLQAVRDLPFVILDAEGGDKARGQPHLRILEKSRSGRFPARLEAILREVAA